MGEALALTIRVFIFSNDDLTSSIIFSPLLENPEVEVTGIAIASSPSRKNRGNFDGAFALLRRMSTRYWFYLIYTHGLFKFFDLLTLLTGLRPRFGYLVSLRALAKRKSIPVSSVSDFGAAAFRKRLAAEDIDLLIIRVGAILGPEVLALPRLGTWCVHSSLLPAFGGIAGEFHALRHPAAPIGTSIFSVELELDKGPPLVQCTCPRREGASVYNHMLRNNGLAGALLSDAVSALAENGRVDPTLHNEGLEPSYFSWPKSAEVDALHGLGHRLLDPLEAFGLVLGGLHFVPQKMPGA